jgi:hypothetical protein
MILPPPLPSLETRWFFPGTSRDYPALRTWFETITPVPRRADVAAPVWKGRMDNRPDIYLLIPGSHDMGIKWREGQLQIKGRVADVGIHQFGERHNGRVDKWLKWSYKGMPPAWEQLFDLNGSAEFHRIAVYKSRALRKIHLDTMTGAATEVPDSAFVDRGAGIELTDVTLNGQPYCSLAFEAFPDDSGLESAFNTLANTFLATLTAITLTAAQSAAWPAFLAEYRQ